MSSIPTNNTSGSGAIITFNENTTSGNAGITLSSVNGVSTTISANGSGGLHFGGTTQTNITFSKEMLADKIKQFHAGKYTRKYMEIYLDFMVMNAMLDNLEYLEYKVSLDKELPQ